MSRKAYPSDLTDAQWAIAEPLVPKPFPRGRPRKSDLREVVNAILYVVREGCSWRALPHDLPPWRTVYNYFDAWSGDGTWERLLTALRRKARVQAGRPETPSACCIDSQSVKTACGGEAVGTDGGKRVKGRKRHIATDTLGLLLTILVTAANADDGETAPALLGRLPAAECRRLRAVFADSKYHNAAFEAYLAGRGGLRLEVSGKAPGEKGFRPLKVRWVVEQSFGCMGRWRRLSKDYERTVRSSEAVVKVAAIHRTLRRLKPARPLQVCHYQRPKKVAQAGRKR